MRIINEYLKLVDEAQKKRIKLTTDQVNSIKRMYNDVWRDFIARSRVATSGSMSERWLNDYRKQFRKAVSELNDMLHKQITGAMEQSATYAADIQSKMFDMLNVKPTFSNMFTRIPKETVYELVNGGFYKDGKGLSKRIWFNEKKANADFDYIIQKGLAEKRSIADIVDDLSKYVNPNAKRDMDFKKIYPNIGNRQIDYNAFRLAVTSISHAYQLSMQRSCKANPFVEGIKWNISNSHRNTCSVCRSRNGKIYKSDELPLDHPNGICYFTPVVPKSMEDIGSELRNWVNGGSNPTLDKWYADNGGKETPKQKNEVNFDLMAAIFKFKRLSKVWPDIEKSIKNSPEFIQNWYGKYQEKLQFDSTSSKRAYYSPSTGGITMHVKNDANNERGAYSTFFHEFGHLLDDVGSKYVNGVKQKLSSDDRFVKAIQEDYNDRLNSQLLKGKPGAFINGKLTDLLRAEGDLASGVQDIYSGLTLNKVRPRWGHDTSYWLRGDTDLEIASEAFAHMSSGFTNPDRLKIMKDWFPKACATFEIIVKELLD